MGDPKQTPDIDLVDLEQGAREGPVDQLLKSLRERDGAKGWSDEFVASGPKPCQMKPSDD